VSRSLFRLGLAPLALLGALSACGPQETSDRASGAVPASAPTSNASFSPPAGVDPARSRAAAAEIFSTRCMPCHGASGMGDGPASAGLTPRPRNFHDVDWQSSVSDTHIEQIIQYGGAAVGKSPAMPSNPDLSSKPELVTALREHVRDLGRH
jgi:mono/diheme cytochrome c family protein